MDSNSPDLPRGLELTSLSPTFRDDPFSVLEDGQLHDHVVFRADLVQKVLTDQTLLVDPRALAQTSTRIMRGEDMSVETSMLHADGARHKRLRTLMLKAFNNRRPEAFPERTREICNELLDAAGGEFDFMQQIARPMPTKVIIELLWVDRSLGEEFKIWSDQAIAFELNPLADEETRAIGAEGLAAIDRTVADEVNRRLSSGDRPDDLISGMMDAQTSAGETFSVAKISQHA